MPRALRLDPASHQPLYQQVGRALREAIESRALAPEDALPSERQLAEDLGVSRITVRKAIEALAAEGFLVRRQGSGNFVCTRIDKNFAKLTSFSEDMHSRGRNPRSTWLRRAQGSVNPEEALKLALGPGSLVYRFFRVRIADDAPMALETTTIDATALPSLDSVGESLYAALEHHGARPVRALQRLRAIVLNAAQARLLQVKTGDAALQVERLGYRRDGRAVELTQSVYRGDTYDFIAELSMS